MINDDSSKKELQRLLKIYFDRSGLTKREIGSRLGVTGEYVSIIINQGEAPSTQTFNSLVDILKISTEEKKNLLWVYLCVRLKQRVDDELLTLMEKAGIIKWEPPK